MKVRVDKTKCIGCGTCIAVAGDFFGLADQGKAKIIKQPQTPADKDVIKKAREFCPTGAIIIEEEK